MASINVRKETGKLYLDFKYRNVRCREQTGLKDSPANRKKLKGLLVKVEAEILLGCFEYEKTFPNSKMVEKFRTIERTLSASEDTPTFAEFARTWFDEMSVHWRKSYNDSVTNILFNRLIPNFGNLKLNEISKAEILGFRVELTKIRKPNGKTFVPSTVNRHMKILRAILNEGAERFDFVSPYRGIKPLKVQKSHVKPFTPEEINLILDAVREDFRDYFTVRFFTGMRTGEIDGLKWKYVDLKNRKIQIRETIVSGVEEYTKNDFSQREIDMSQPVYESLLNMHQCTSNNVYVFCNRNGKPLDHNQVTKRVWYPLLQRVGVEKRNPYQMRHTAATLWLASGESPEWIANQMGHANTEMLFRIYSRYVPNLTRQDGIAANSMFKSIRQSRY